MNKLNLVLAGIGSAALMSYGVAVYAGPTVTQATNTSSATTNVSSTTISWDEKGNNAYGISVSHSGNVWTYTVSEVAGKSLSHWLVGITSCAGHITSVSGPSSTKSGGSVSVDGSTGVNGLKWDTDEGFTSGSFVITLDKEYAVGTTTVLAKAGTIYATNGIQGPDCTKEVVTVVDTDEDGVADEADNCPADANMNQADVDGDKIGDACDPVDDVAKDAAIVTYGDDDATSVAIWENQDGSLVYIDTVPVAAFDAKFQEGVDYQIVDDGSGQYVLEGLNDAGEITSKVEVVRIQ